MLWRPLLFCDRLMLNMSHAARLLTFSFALIVTTCSGSQSVDLRTSAVQLLLPSLFAEIFISG